MASHHKSVGTAIPARSVPEDDSAGYRGDLAETLPPTPLRELFAASGVTLYVLTTDTAFVETVRRAVGEHYPLFFVSAWEELLAAVDSRQCGVALLDATLLGGPRAAESLRTLRPYAHRLVTLVAADRALAKDLVTLSSSAGVHRLLIKPVAAGATRLFIDSAVERRLQLQDRQASEVFPPGETRRFPPARVVGGVATALALVGVLAWWAPWRAPESGPVASTPPPAAAEEAAAAVFDRRLADLRARAALALQQGRLTEPRGDAAIDHYLALLALVPGDADARAGMAAVIERLFASVETALLEQSYEAAAKDLDQLRRVDPSSSRLAFLDAQLARALATVVAPPAAAVSAEGAAGAALDELDSVLSLASARLARGDLLTPTGDSAFAYLERAVRIDAEDERVVALRREVSAAMLAAARLLVNADVAAATGLVARARGLGADAGALTRLEGELAAARARAADRRQGERLGVARERIRQGALFGPGDSTALTELESLQSEAPETNGLGEAWEEFVEAVRARTAEALDNGDWQAAEAGVAALGEAPGGAPVAAPLAVEIEARQRQVSYLAEAAPAGELMLRSAPPAVYPPEAVQRGIEGWVEVEFVVDRAGATREAVVRQADPPQRFDAAALAAVASYRYAPFERDGRVYERRVRLRIRFDLE